MPVCCLNNGGFGSIIWKMVVFSSVCWLMLNGNLIFLRNSTTQPVGTAFFPLFRLCHLCLDFIDTFLWKASVTNKNVYLGKCKIFRACHLALVTKVNSSTGNLINQQLSLFTVWSTNLPKINSTSFIRRQFCKNTCIGTHTHSTFHFYCSVMEGESISR